MISIVLNSEGLNDPALKIKCQKGFGRIYKFTPLFQTTSNGYIGRNETSLWKRLQGHKTPKSECSGLSNAIKKHGLWKFQLSVLEDEIPQSKLADAERKYIEIHDTYHNGYNCTPGGEAPPLLCPNVAAKVKATKNTAESKAKTIAASRKHWDNPVEHKKHAESLAKSRNDPNVRKKASESSTKVWARDGFKERLSEIQKVSQNKPKRKQQLSKQMTDLWSDPSIKKSRSQAIKEGRARAKAARGGVTKYVRRT